MKHFITLILFLGVLSIGFTTTSCSKDENIAEEDPNNPFSLTSAGGGEDNDTTTTGGGASADSTGTTSTDTIPGFGQVGSGTSTTEYDKIPAEHDITYSVLSHNEYTALQFYNYYISKAQELMSTMPSSSSSGMSSKDYLKKLLSNYSSLKGKLIGKYYTTQIQYTTTDIDNNPIEASALLVWHNSGTINEVLYSNHGTRAGDFDSPSNGFSPEVFFSVSGALVIIPDYIGDGITRGMSEPYLVAQNGGDVAVDGYLAGLKYAKENISNFSSSYSGYIVGYSQGGSVSLAALRSVQQRSAARQEMLNVKRCVCGDGPYDLEATFKTYLSQSTLMLPVVLPLAINGMMAGYPDWVKDLDYNSCFTSDALATGVPQAIHNNNGTTGDLMGFYSSGGSANDILASKITNRSGTDYDLLIKLLKRQNLCTGWTPKYPILFIHDKGDTVVPYVNMTNAASGLNSSLVTTQTIDEGGDHYGGAIYVMTKIMAGQLYK